MPPPRKNSRFGRRVAKWAATFATAALLAAWALSGWWFVEWAWGGNSATRVMLVAGCVEVSAVSGPGVPGQSFGPPVPPPPFPGMASAVSRPSIRVRSPFWYWQAAPFTLGGQSPGSRPVPFWPYSAWESLIVLSLPWPIVLLGAVTTVFWIQDSRAARRARVGRCRSCRYDRTGLPGSAPCPECGSPLPPPPAPSRPRPAPAPDGPTL